MGTLTKWARGLRLKLLILGLIPVFVLSGLSYNALRSLNDFRDRLDYAYNVRVALVETAGQMDASIHALGRWMWITYGMAGKTEAQSGFITKSIDEISRFEKTKETYHALPKNDQTKKLFASVEQEWLKARAGAEEALEIFKIQTTESNEAAKLVMQQKMLPHLVPITKTMMEIKNQMHEILAQETASVNAFAGSTNRKMLLLSIACMIFCLGFAIYLGTHLTKRLTAISSSLHDSSIQVHSSSVQIASASTNLSSSVTEQAASLAETAASLAQISAMISTASENSNLTSESSKMSQARAQEGQTTIDQMVQAMDDISQSNDDILKQVNISNQKMFEIVKVIQSIGEKTKVINEIVFQTKLLSFNASVEAARAGEHGKGFAVVAEEVGNLAQMSGNAAKEISDMLDESIARVKAMVDETKSSVESLITEGRNKIDGGVAIAKSCATILHDIVKNVEKVAGLAQEISRATQEQSQGVSEINNAVGQLDIVTQQNAARSEETAHAAEELSAQADSLKGAVADLVFTVEGKQSQLAHHPQPDEVEFTPPTRTRVSSYSPQPAIKTRRNDSDSQLKLHG